MSVAGAWRSSVTASASIKKWCGGTSASKGAAPAAASLTPWPVSEADPPPPLGPACRSATDFAHGGPSFRAQHFLLPSGIDLVAAPSPCPADVVTPDPVVRLARKAPVADRWAQRDRHTVEGQRPLGRGERRDGFVAAPTAASMYGDGVPRGDVHDPVVKKVRDGVDKFMSDAIEARHSGSSRMSVPVSTA